MDAFESDDYSRRRKGKKGLGKARLMALGVGSIFAITSGAGLVAVGASSASASIVEPTLTVSAACYNTATGYVDLTYSATNVSTAGKYHLLGDTSNGNIDVYSDDFVSTDGSPSGTVALKNGDTNLIPSRPFALDVELGTTDGQQSNVLVEQVSDCTSNPAQSSVNATLSCSTHLITVSGGNLPGENDTSDNIYFTDAYGAVEYVNVVTDASGNITGAGTAQPVSGTFEGGASTYTVHHVIGSESFDSGTITFQDCTAQPTTRTVHVKSSSLDQSCPEGQVPTSGQFNLTQIVPDQPAAINAVLANPTATDQVGQSKVDGKTVQYVVQLQPGQTISDATAVVPVGWSGQFVLSHYNCGTVTPPPACVSNEDAQFTVDFNGPNGTAEVKVKGDEELCNAKQVSLVSYQGTTTGGPSAKNVQTRFDLMSSDSFTKDSGALTVEVPSCNAQVDLIWGTNAPKTLDADFFGPNHTLIESWKGTKKCESTPTPTPTSTYTPPPVTYNPTASVLNCPAVVVLDNSASTGEVSLEIHTVDSQGNLVGKGIWSETLEAGKVLPVSLGNLPTGTVVSVWWDNSQIGGPVTLGSCTSPTASNSPTPTPTAPVAVVTPPASPVAGPTPNKVETGFGGLAHPDSNDGGMPDGIIVGVLLIALGGLGLAGTFLYRRQGSASA